jgi:hypothetical protein
MCVHAKKTEGTRAFDEIETGQRWNRGGGASKERYGGKRRSPSQE